MTHSELCLLGAKWLINQKTWKFRCQYVVTEFTSISQESPDIFGLKGGWSTILVEVKMSRSDYFADKKKRHREGKGIGLTRYYLCPKGLIRPEELPAKWGLLYCDNDKISVVKESEGFEERDFADEVSIFYSIIRRLSKRGILFKT